MLTPRRAAPPPIDPGQTPTASADARPAPAEDSSTPVARATTEQAADGAPPGFWPGGQKTPVPDHGTGPAPVTPRPDDSAAAALAVDLLRDLETARFCTLALTSRARFLPCYQVSR